ncbi:cell division protein FtsN [Obesumbacterium proteus]|uniref:cell division protein FtsN n=1 Tax=Obesumbacterium proteus TaxID=82983 RepID=UPI001033FEEE|nr:cell division protein FtsN [Obesumbacterium proteus]TBL72896.1 cell division protein FtsN [Obesumbacterium proteus]
MAQRDYVSRGRSSGAKRKTNTRKKKKSSPGISKTMVVVALGVLVTFAAGLYFLTHHKPDSDELLPTQAKHAGNGLPPKPEERWRYIKELENRQVGVATPTDPTSNAATAPTQQPQLTAEQRQLLDQMQSDMRQQPTQLSEVPYNDQTQIARRAPQNSRMPDQTYTQQQPVTNSQPRNPFSQQNTAPAQPRQTTTEPARPVRTAPPVQATQPPVQQPHKEKPAPVTSVAEQPAPAKEAKTEKAPEKENTQKWMVQCGSFRSTDQAESVRAQLAFGGVESRITAGGGWNRVLLGPYTSRASADKMLQRLKGDGMSGCIALSVGG